MSIPNWTWPDWRKAERGTRFRHNRSGRTGVFIQPARNPHNGAIVVWDDPNPVGRPRPDVLADAPGSTFFVAPARDLTPLT